MKKNLLLLICAGLLLSCSEDYLSNENREYVSQEQLNDLASSSPEALLTLNVGVLDGTYTFLNEFSTNGGGNHDDFGLKSIHLGLDLMSNDMVQEVYHWFGRYYRYDGRTEPSRITDMVWNFFYKVIRNTNSIARQIPSDTDNADLRHVLGRALALRGFSYFNLIRVYGDGTRGIPLYNEVEDLPSRVDEATIYAQIESDLTLAFDLLHDFGRPDKTEIDQNIVAGLLARYYLQTGEYGKCITNAQIAKNSVPLMNAAELADGFDDINNPEWMWGADITSLTSTIYASLFSHIGNLNPGYNGIFGIYKSIDSRLMDEISPTDLRGGWFNGSAYGISPYANTKFIDATFFEGDYLYMRGAEFYLIEAEARALNSNDSGAAQVLYNLVSTRDPNYTLSTNTGAALLEEIRTHRRLELWGEGFSFYDMKRWGWSLERDYTGSNHAAYGKYNYPANAKEFQFQIPQGELNSNEEINDPDQNPL